MLLSFHRLIPLAIALQIPAMVSPGHAAESSAAKKTATLWYQAFDRNEPGLLDKILSDKWIDIPPAPNQPVGPVGAQQILTELRAAFPDLRIAIQDILQDGEKVI